MRKRWKLKSECETRKRIKEAFIVGYQIGYFDRGLDDKKHDCETFTLSKENARRFVLDDEKIN